MCRTRVIDLVSLAAGVLKRRLLSNPGFYLSGYLGQGVVYDPKVNRID